MGAGSRQSEIYRLGASGPSLNSVLAAVDGTNRKLALLHIDVDGIGAINATLGENIVEQALRVVARRLVHAVPDDAWLWRLGSEEFVAAIAYRDGESDGETLAERLREAFDAPVQVQPFVLDVTLSIGIALYPDHAHDAAALLVAAEQTMRRAKRSGPGGQAIHVPDALPDPANDPGREHQGHRFVDAIAQSEFRLYYQPVVSAQDGSIVACSSLLRWHNTQEGVLRANRILPAVERAGLAGAVGLWTIETAIGQVQRCDRVLLDDDGGVAGSPDLLQHLLDLLHDHRGQALVGLVEQQQLDVARQRPGDRQHLLLAAGHGHRLLQPALKHLLTIAATFTCGDMQCEFDRSFVCGLQQQFRIGQMSHRCRASIRSIFSSVFAIDDATEPNEMPAISLISR